MLPDYRVRQRDYLLDISRAITEALELDRVLARIVHSSTELLAGHAGIIVLREKEGWRIAASNGIPEAFLKELEPLFEDISDQGGAEQFELSEINRRLQRITRAASMGLLTGVGLPLTIENHIIGMIFVFRSYRGVFSRDDQNLLRQFASQASIAVHNARLYTELTQQKQHLDAILDSAADGIFILDPAFRFQRFNPACTRMTEFTPEDVLEKEYDEILRWLKREPGQSLKEATANGWPLTPQATLYVEGDLKTKSGGVISVGIIYAPAVSKEGQLLSIVGSLRDITKFREAEELKSTFISIISHELRTPVALIKGYVGTLRRDDAEWDADTVNESLSVIEDETDRLASLIDDLLDASRLQANAMDIALSEIDIKPLIERAVNRFMPQSDRHTFSMDVFDELPTVLADEHRLTQAVNNLLSNAVKYSPEGGAVHVTARLQGEEIIVCVQDDGPGIAIRDVPRVFDLFYRSVDASRKVPGAGLGLYLTKSVIEAHGGRIWINEKVEHGACICFSLPIQQDDI
ncbi:MAG: PAS domain S-box protein [Anaerolineales bacterium]|nr:PAS domain S-box protein [Anaerolineales bacterium]